MEIAEMYSIFLETMILSVSKYRVKFRSNRESFFEVFFKIFAVVLSMQVIKSKNCLVSFMPEDKRPESLKTILILYWSFSISYNNYVSWFSIGLLWRCKKLTTYPRIDGADHWLKRSSRWTLTRFWRRLGWTMEIWRSWLNITLEK